MHILYAVPGRSSIRLPGSRRNHLRRIYICLRLHCSICLQGRRSLKCHRIQSQQGIRYRHFDDQPSMCLPSTFSCTVYPCGGTRSQADRHGRTLRQVLTIHHHCKPSRSRHHMGTCSQPCMACKQSSRSHPGSSPSHSCNQSAWTDRAPCAGRQKAPDTPSR